jgi:hypothetical protein
VSGLEPEEYKNLLFFQTNMISNLVDCHCEAWANWELEPSKAQTTVMPPLPVLELDLWDEDDPSGFWSSQYSALEVFLAHLLDLESCAVAQPLRHIKIADEHDGCTVL